MDYEKKYNEALNLAKSYYGKGTNEFLDTIFPELKESEDEKIRKQLINEVEEQINNIPAPDCCDSDDLKRLTILESWLTYLEKQKENPDRAILIGKAKLEKQVVLLAESNGDENIYWDTKSEEDAVSLLEKGLKFFGKQKEQKSDNPCDGCNNVKGCINCVDGSEWAHIEEKEQKPSSYSHLEITNVVRRALQECEGFKNYRADVYAARVGATVETLLQEQKPEEIDEYEIIKKHITEDALSGEVNKRLKECGWYVTEEKPAEWNPTNEDVDLFNKAVITNTTLTPSERAKLDIIRMKFKHCGGKITKTVEWGEDVIRKAVEEVGLTQHQIDWFKTNVFPPKQEWSEEDEKNFYWISTKIQQANMTPEYSAKVYEILSWLKSLRPQPHWKPSEEQMDCLVVAASRYGNSEVANVLNSLIDDLEKL